MSSHFPFSQRVIVSVTVCAFVFLSTIPGVTANQVGAPSKKQPTVSTAAVQRFFVEHGRNTRGLRRGPFDVGKSTQRLQVAYVIDSSLDMNSLDLLRNVLPNFLNDKIKGSDPKRAIVYEQNGIYVANDFRTSDVELENPLHNLATGAPSNRRDFWDGVVKAVTELNWDTREKDTLRWVIVCGNSASELRTITQEESLARLARAKNISIMSLLFQSDPSASLASRQRAKQILTKLSSETAGSFIDLGSQSSIDFWNGESKPLDKPSTPPQDDLTIRVVGPEWANKTLEVMRSVLRQVPCAVVGSSDSSKYSVEVTQSNFRGRVKIEASLRFQDVELASAQKVSLNSWDEFDVQNAAGKCLRELLSNAASTLNDAPSHQKLTKRIVDHLDRSRELRCMVANHPRARDEIMAALDLLQQSHLIEDAVVLQQTMTRVMAHLINADFYDRGNAFAFLLMANAQFNLAQAANESGDQQGEEQAFRKRYLLYLGRAYQASLAMPEVSPIRMVIEAEYCLSFGHNANDFEKAIKLYEKITDHPLRATADIELRARWMLCGLYEGAWNIASKAEGLKDPAAALRHIKRILERWPNSPEAKLLRHEMEKKEFRFPISDNQFAMTFLTAPTMLGD